MQYAWITLQLSTPPAKSTEKLSASKLVPGDKKVGDCCFNWFLITQNTNN